MSLQIEYVDPKKLIPAPYNPRKWTKKQIDGLTNSIKEFGICEPFIVNKQTGHLVGGHFRRKISINLEIDSVPVVYVDLSLEKEKALNIALNNQYIAGDWSPDLGDVLADIKSGLPELFDDLNLGELLPDVPEIELPSIEPEEETDKVVICPQCGFELK